MKIVQLVLSIGLISVSNLAFSQAANTAALQALSANATQGAKCAQLLNNNNTKQLMNPSAAVKSVFLIEPKLLMASEQFKKLNDQERKAVSEMIEASKTCANHANGLRTMSNDLAAAGNALQADKAAQDQIKKVMESHEQVSKTMQSIGAASPDLAHFMHMHGQ
jgi:flagellar motor component MotA